MSNLSDPVLIAIVAMLMGLLGGLSTIPISAVAAWMLRNHQQENQQKLDLFAKKQNLLLRHRMELQRQNKSNRRLKASIIELKAGQKKQAEEMRSIVAPNEQNLTNIKKSVAELGQGAFALANKVIQLDEYLVQLKASVVELKAGQKKQVEEIRGIIAADEQNLTNIKKSLVELGQGALALTNKTAQLDEQMVQLEKSKVREQQAAPQAAIAQLEMRLSTLENLHDGLKQDS